MPEKGAFIHIPKNAGESIRAMLKQLNGRVSYNNHDTDAKKLNPSVPQIVILRDPIDRFCSAIQYAFDKWSGEPHVRNLINIGLTDYNDVIQAFADPDHKNHNDVCAEIKDIQQKHKIGSRNLTYRWIYTPQSEWVWRPGYVVLFENLKEELEMVWKTFGASKMNEIKKNTSGRKNIQLTPENQAFLREFYRDDYALLEKYRSIPASQRCSGEGLSYNEDGSVQL